jgi:IS5 family transposase
MILRLTHLPSHFSGEFSLQAIAYLTNNRLLEKSCQLLVKLATQGGLSLRQDYNRQGPRLAEQVRRYVHARQFKRMNKTLRALKARVGLVHREVIRQLD